LSFCKNLTHADCCCLDDFQTRHAVCASAAAIRFPSSDRASRCYGHTRAQVVCGTRVTVAGSCFLANLCRLSPLHLFALRVHLLAAVTVGFNAASFAILCCFLQNTISALSGATIGGGFGVSTWAPYLCLLPNSVSALIWIQFTLLLSAFPMAAGMATLTPRVSTYFWKGVSQPCRASKPSLCLCSTQHTGSNTV
jgi:hypothetical protein